MSDQSRKRRREYAFKQFILDEAEESPLTWRQSNEEWAMRMNWQNENKRPYIDVSKGEMERLCGMARLENSELAKAKSGTFPKSAHSIIYVLECSD
jgi:hypothetical protein